MENGLHIVAFDIPYPPNYGGVIDVFYKIKWLSESGIKITLHCFEYHRRQAPELETYCERVYYYKRRSGFGVHLSFLPYIVLSRKNNDLLSNLLTDQHPILFEGLHACYYLNDPRLASRFKIYRESNIEHEYYFHLFKAQQNPIKAFYFLIESIRLYFYQNRLKAADLMLAVSQKDTSYLQKRFPSKKVMFLPSFHANDQVRSLLGKGSYVLYHGNLAVKENEKAAIFLLKHVFNDLPLPFVIAGMHPSSRLRNWVARFDHVTLYDTPTEMEMLQLLRDAHVHALVTFQATGLKLKLLNVLYAGRFCVCNQKMVSGTNLEPLCRLVDAPTQWKAAIQQLMISAFTTNDVAKRKELLDSAYGNQANVQKLIHWIFPSNRI
ncbi:MAG: glycosyltransferase family 1 protein [Microbacter sp.]